MSWVIGILVEAWSGALTEAERALWTGPLIARAAGTCGDGAADRRLGDMAARWALSVHAPAWLSLAGFPRFAAIFATGLSVSANGMRLQKDLLQASLAGLEAAVAVEREGLVLRALEDDAYELCLVGRSTDLWDLAAEAAAQAMEASAGTAAVLAAGATMEAGTDSGALWLLASVAETSAALVAGAAAGRAVFDLRMNMMADSRRPHAEAALAATTAELKRSAFALVMRMILESERTRSA